MWKRVFWGIVVPVGIAAVVPAAIFTVLTASGWPAREVSAAEPPVVFTEDARVILGDFIEIPIMLDSAPAGLAGFRLSVTVGSPIVVFAATSDMLPIVSIAPEGATIAAVDLMDLVTPGMTGIELARLTVKAEAAGQASLTTSVTAMDDDSGSPMQPEMFRSVVEVVWPTLPGQSEPVGDLNGDGLAEDLNGNGRRDFDDVVLLFSNLELITHPKFFDFDDNGVLSFNDVVVLFQGMLDA